MGPGGSGSSQRGRPGPGPAWPSGWQVVLSDHSRGFPRVPWRWWGAVLTPSFTDASSGGIISAQGHGGSHGHHFLQPCLPDAAKSRNTGGLQRPGRLDVVSTTSSPDYDHGPLLSTREWVASTGFPRTRLGAWPLSLGCYWAGAVGVGHAEKRRPQSRSYPPTSCVPHMMLGVGSSALTFSCECNRWESATSETFKKPNSQD